MLVDDEKLVLRALSRALRREGYQLITACGGEEALKYLRNDSDVHLIISDHKMPKMTGMELLVEVRRLYPTIVRILLTAHADMDTAIEGINKGKLYRFLTKPWQEAELKETVRQALQFWKAVNETREAVLVMKKGKEARVENPSLSVDKKDVKVTK